MLVLTTNRHCIMIRGRTFCVTYYFEFECEKDYKIKNANEKKITTDKKWKEK